MEQFCEHGDDTPQVGAAETPSAKLEAQEQEIVTRGQKGMAWRQEGMI